MLLCDSYITFLIEAKVVNLPEVTSDRVLDGVKPRSVTLCRDARPERPLCQRLQHRGFNGDGRTDRASLQRVTRLALSVSFFVSLGLRNINLIELDRYGDTFFRGVPH